MRSLFESDWQGSGVPINLMMGSEDEAHVGKFADHPLIRIVPWDLESLPSMRSNCTLNKIRAVTWGDAEATLMVEDDVLFKPTWYSELQRAVAELGDRNYVLCLFSHKPLLEQASLVEGKTWIKHYPMENLQGAQAVYYPNREVRTMVADYLRVHLGKACGDVLIGRAAKELMALYATEDLLVDHIGQVSCYH
jgi:hypothetical protein